MPLTVEQLAFRKSRISASDVAVILGLNPWKTPADLWLEKTQDIEPMIETEAIEIGNMAESPLIDWCAASLGVQPDRELGTVPHPDHDWLCATPDAGIVGQKRGIVVNSAADVEFKGLRVDTNLDGDTQEVTESLGHYRSVNVNVFVDGRADAEVLEALRESVQGNTICDCPVFDSLNEDDREWVRSHAPNGWWAEWPARD